MFGVTLMTFTVAPVGAVTLHEMCLSADDVALASCLRPAPERGNRAIFANFAWTPLFFGLLVS